MKTKLTRSDYKQIDFIANAEAEARLGPPPTLHDVHGGWLSSVLDFISGLGQVLNLVVVEFIQAFTAMLLLVGFGLLEAERIYSGVLVLGQHETQAQLIAVAFVVANMLLPVYSLRALRGKKTLTRTRHTLRGWLGAFWRRLVCKPQTYAVGPSDNPTLRVAESAVTWATLVMAMLAVLGPTLARYAEERWYTALGLALVGSNFSEFLELVGGLLISVGGVFMLQSIAFEAAVRAHVERPASARELLEGQRREYNAAVAAIRREVMEEYAAGKLADRERHQQPVMVRGNGHHDPL